MSNSTPKIALISGASRGIGRAIVERLAHDGLRVLGTATTEKGQQCLVDQCKRQGLNVHGLVLDLSSKDSINQVVEQITAEYGGVDILINNAGITRDNLLLRMGDDEWQQVIDTNLTGVFRLTRALLRPMLKKKWGRIIHISSIIGLLGNAGQSNYAAAKAGLIALGKSLAREVASKGITVNTVAPGFIDTDMTKALTDQQREAMLQRIPMRRLGQAQDVAHAVAFLASEQAAYLTGETLHVNGGMLMD